MGRTKNTITIVAAALSFLCCTNVIDRYPTSADKSLTDTLFVVSSFGAFSNDKLGEIYPQESYVVLDWSSTDIVSIRIKYSWHHDSSGFIAEIPNVKVVGSRDDFLILDEGGYEAQCKCWYSNTVKESSIQITIKSSLHRSSDDVTASFFLTPSDNSMFPELEIWDVRSNRVEYDRTGGDIVEYPLLRCVFTNELDCPITILWEQVLSSSIEIDSRASITLFSNLEPLSPLLSSMIDFPAERQNYPATVIANDKSVVFDFFEDSVFSIDNISEFRLDSGEIESVSYKVAYFSVTQLLFNQ